MIPYSWILYTLNTYNVNPIYIKILECTMSKWKTTLILKTNSESALIQSNKIEINTGIF